MYLIHTPAFVQNLFPRFLWREETDEKKIYLTFDDGPVPEVTPWVLDQLKQHNAHATFFCVGENVMKYPDLFRQIKEQGHGVGNHTHNHLSGWATDYTAYIQNVEICSQLVNSTLFRPPYGRLRRRQAQELMRHYRIVMWDVLSGDFDPELDPVRCYSNVVDHAGEGSIVVFHDSVKAWDNLHYTLPRVLSHFRDKGFEFARLKSTAVAHGRRLRQIA